MKSKRLVEEKNWCLYCGKEIILDKNECEECTAGFEGDNERRGGMTQKDTTVQIKNRKVKKFEVKAKELFPQMNPRIFFEGDIYNSFVFDTVTKQERERVLNFAHSF